MHNSFALLAQFQPERQSSGIGNPVIIVAFGVAAIACLFFLVAAIAFAAYGKLWFQAYMSSADVSMMSLIGMGFPTTVGGGGADAVDLVTLCEELHYAGGSGGLFASLFTSGRPSHLLGRRVQRSKRRLPEHELAPVRVRHRMRWNAKALKPFRRQLPAPIVERLTNAPRARRGIESVVAVGLTEIAKSDAGRGAVDASRVLAQLAMSWRTSKGRFGES